MPVGISAIQASPGVKNKMPPQKVGTDFLVSSHFKIAQDNSVIDGSVKSIFKKDYIPWETHSKPKGAVPPKPADLLQTDDRYFNEKASETKQAYEYRKPATLELKDVHANLGATNFKMDSDPRLNSFQTTHNRDYSPKAGEVIREGQARNLMDSYIPQGDPERAADPISDYRDRYRGHNVAKPDKAGAAFQGAPTILGDNRQHHFRTTSMATFRGQRLPKLSAYPAPTGSNLPQGDTSNEVNQISTHQVSFPQHALVGRPYDKTEVMGKLASTNFTQTDGHGAWDNYLSTMTDSYRPAKKTPQRECSTTHRNHSDFPLGDDDPRGNAGHVNMTTNRFYLGDPPKMQKPKIVSGANKKTKSQVWFGEPTQAKNFYSTTTDSTFRPVSLSYNLNRPDLQNRNGVPLDYYADNQNNTTYRTYFFDKDQARMISNPQAVLELKESHILAPLGGDRWFSTEHLEQFTPKRTTLIQVGDPWRLQRSSVPIGILNAAA